MKKILFFVLHLIFCAKLCAGEFKITYGAAGPQSLTNIQLSLLQATPPYISVVTTSSISPTDYSPTDSSVTISYPGSSQQIICSFNIPTESTTYAVSNIILPDTNYILGYDSSRDVFFLTMNS